MLLLLPQSFPFGFVRGLVADQNRSRNRHDVVRGTGSRPVNSDLRFDSTGQGYVSIRDSIHNRIDCNLIHFGAFLADYHLKAVL